jgi:hypothetical protein
LIDAPHAEPGFARDVADRRGVKALFAEDLFGGFEKPGKVRFPVP